MPKIGRPSRGREHTRITISVSEAERDVLHQRAEIAGLTMSEWARQVLLADPPPAVPGRPSEG